MFTEIDIPVFLQESFSLNELIQKGGVAMWIILIMSIVALAIVIERILFFRKNQMHIENFLLGIINLLRQKKITEALQRCDGGYGHAVRIIQIAILKRNFPPTELRHVVKETAQLQVRDLENRLALLSTITYLAPLMGLLGTTLGMIDVFIEIQRHGQSIPITDLSSGIWTALLTTAAGLSVAIPCYLAYNYLVFRVHNVKNDMERAGIEIIHVLTDPTDYSTAVLNLDKKSSSPSSK